MEVPQYVAERFFTSDSVGGIPMSGVHAARCPVCADHKKRMYLIHDVTKGYRVFCHNCAYSSSLLRFVKDFFPYNYESMTSECVKEYVFSFGKKKKRKSEEKLDDLNESLGKALRNIKKSKEVKPKHYAQEYIEKNCFKLQENCPDSSMQTTIDDCRRKLFERRLNVDLIDSMYYAFDGKYKQRVIIPFFDVDKDIYYFQAMATQDWQMKYKYINFDHISIEEKPAYNEFHVNKDKDVYLVEGLFDSTFVKNSISTLGVSMGRTRIKGYMKSYRNRIWIMDNDSEGLKLTKQLYEKNETCVLFPREYRKIKDLNALAIELGVDDLTEKIKKMTYNGLDGLLEMNRR